MNARTHNHTSTPRRTGRFGRRLAAASVVAATLFGLAAGPASADFGANVATIKQTGFQAHGTYAHMQWTADVLSTVIEVSTAAPQQVNGKWQFPGPATKATVPMQGGKFEYYARPLQPAHQVQRDPHRSGQWKQGNGPGQGGFHDHGQGATPHHVRLDPRDRRRRRRHQGCR